MKGEEIRIGEVRICKGSRTKRTQMKVNIRIMCSDMEDPKIESDGQTLGTIEVEFPNQDADDMKVTMEWHFAETVIKAVVYRNKEPNKKQIRYINKNWA